MSEKREKNCRRKEVKGLCVRFLFSAFLYILGLLLPLLCVVVFQRPILMSLSIHSWLSLNMAWLCGSSLSTHCFYVSLYEFSRNFFSLYAHSNLKKGLNRANRRFWTEEKRWSTLGSFGVLSTCERNKLKESIERNQKRGKKKKKMSVVHFLVVVLWRVAKRWW